PSGILGHRPRICYTAHGWTHDQTELVDFYTTAGRKVTALLHHFHKPGALGNEIYVMHFYVLNGQISTEEDRFSGFFGRRPNLSGDPARYVAQVQISSVRRDDILLAAQETTEIILRYLPGTEQAAAATPGS
ncbi:MAG: hypothetical protein JW810_11255, partial [Sedimentisphaerales bacterium]|nr:hypothetical protein [Sedimentisphaerales bacterium]